MLALKDTTCHKSQPRTNITGSFHGEVLMTKKSITLDAQELLGWQSTASAGSKPVLLATTKAGVIKPPPAPASR
jgi:hypothetical protein